MLTSRHLIENAQGKINVIIKSTISLKHDDWVYYYSTNLNYLRLEHLWFTLNSFFFFFGL